MYIPAWRKHSTDSLETPDSRKAFTRQEEHYNKWNWEMRVIVECAFVKWKKRSAILEEVIQLEPECTAQVVMACEVLHNMMIDIGCTAEEYLGTELPYAVIRREAVQISEPIWSIQYNCLFLLWQ
ncbi:hypothetical protein Aduo_018782 [Ancylostoma duodenale]